MALQGSGRALQEVVHALEAGFRALRGAPVP